MVTQAVCPHCGTTNRVAAGHPASAAKCGRCAGALKLDQPLDVDDAALASHLKSTRGLVLLDVWAPWCGPCRAMAPQFAAAAQVLTGQARLLKLNADTSQTVRHLGVSGIPALLMFRDGNVIDRKAGLLPKDEVVAWVRANAAASATAKT